MVRRRGEPPPVWPGRTSKDTLEDDLRSVGEQYEEIRMTPIVAADRPFGSSIASLDDESD